MQPGEVTRATTDADREHQETEEVNGYQADDQRALRAYHLRRVTSKFSTTISPENAQRLARLLAPDSNVNRTPDD